MKSTNGKTKIKVDTAIYKYLKEGVQELEIVGAKEVQYSNSNAIMLTLRNNEGIEGNLPVFCDTKYNSVFYQLINTIFEGELTSFYLEDLFGEKIEAELKLEGRFLNIKAISQIRNDDDTHVDSRKLDFEDNKAEIDDAPEYPDDCEDYDDDCDEDEDEDEDEDNEPEPKERPFLSRRNRR